MWTDKIQIRSKLAITELPGASVSKRCLVQNLDMHENKPVDSFWTCMVSHEDSFRHNGKRQLGKGLLNQPMSKHRLTFRRRLLWFIDFWQFSGSYWIGENRCWRTPRRGDWWSRREAVGYLRGVGRNGACDFDHQSVASSKSAETKQ